MDKVVILSKEYNVEPLKALKIIKCESAFNPFAKGLNKKDEKVWSTDIGWWQINNFYHQETAQKMGLDIENPDDNLTYGFYLLSKQGVKHWKASAPCHGYW